MTDAESSGVLQLCVVRRETCSLSAIRRVAAMLDEDPDKWSEGDALPRGWQFILLGADTRRSALREDGFSGLGVPLPDLGLPRLMLGGRTVRFDGDIPIGATLRRESRMQDISRKDTKNGPMAIVTIAHALYLAEASPPVLVETQTYVLLSGAASAGRAREPAEQPTSGPTKRVLPDDTLLFQYSALGFNSHRIHLDRSYARQAEGFPDLVVNGGLATLLLTEFLRTDLGGIPARLTARHTAPLFCDRPIMLNAERGDGGWALRAFDDSGRLAVGIEVET